VFHKAILTVAALVAALTAGIAAADARMPNERAHVSSLRLPADPVPVARALRGNQADEKPVTTAIQRANQAGYAAAHG
jgi:hypothetical protein